MDKKLALETLKSFVKNTDNVIAKDAILALHPELAESEDERIRDVLIKLLKVPRKEIFEHEGITKEQAIAYLEKQKTSEEAIRYLKENHSSEKVSDFQAAMNIAVARAYDKGVQDTLEKQKEPLTPEKKMKHPLYVEGFEAGKQVGAQYETVFGKPHWKPSEEQMADLRMAATMNSITCPFLETLYNELKKL